MSELIDEIVWPGSPGGVRTPASHARLIAAGLAALGPGGGLMAKRRLGASRHVRLLGVVESRKLRPPKGAHAQGLARVSGRVLVPAVLVAIDSTRSSAAPDRSTWRQAQA